jgi:hypothetical protein
MDSSILPRSRSLVKIPSAGGQLARQIEAPEAAVVGDAGHEGALAGQVDGEHGGFRES